MARWVSNRKKAPQAALHWITSSRCVGIEFDAAQFAPIAIAEFHAADATAPNRLPGDLAPIRQKSDFMIIDASSTDGRLLAATPTLLPDVAERLFAQLGMDAVSLLEQRRVGQHPFSPLQPGTRGSVA